MPFNPVVPQRGRMWLLVRLVYWARVAGGEVDGVEPGDRPLLHQERTGLRVLERAAPLVGVDFLRLVLGCHLRRLQSATTYTHPPTTTSSAGRGGHGNPGDQRQGQGARISRQFLWGNPGARRRALRRCSPPDASLVNAGTAAKRRRGHRGVHTRPASLTGRGERENGRKLGDCLRYCHHTPPAAEHAQEALT